jgi:uncharacterized protein DUF3108
MPTGDTQTSLSIPRGARTPLPASAFIIPFMLVFVLLPRPLFAGWVPERLVYALSWNGIPVGTATQEITGEEDMHRIVATARSNAWLSLFWPVDDRIESLLDAAGAPFPGAIRWYRMRMHEGGHRRDREIVFDRDRGNARYRDRLSGEQAEVAVPSGVYDIYGSFYYVRYLPLTVGTPLSVTVLDGREARRIEVRVLGRETLTTVLGRVATLVVQPQVRPEGVFEGKKGVTIWLTDDERRLPVKVMTGVAVGSVTATLTGVGP